MVCQELAERPGIAAVSLNEAVMRRSNCKRLPRMPISDKSLSVNIRQCFVHKIVQLLTCILRRFGNGMFLEVK